jgi:hypothetical protein
MMPVMLHSRAAQLCVVMFQTYEVDVGGTPDEYEEMGKDPSADDLGWWQKCFVPRYPVGAASNPHASSTSTDPDIQKKNVGSSATTTANTSSARSDGPGWTDVTSNTSPQQAAQPDVETPSIIPPGGSSTVIIDACANELS